MQTARNHHSEVPFARDCPYRDAFGINESQVQTVVAVLAAEACGVEATTAAVADLIGASAHNYMAGLERKGWVECSGKLPRKNTKTWRGTKRAWRELGLTGWQVEVAA